VSSDEQETYGDEAPLVSMVSAANLASLHNDVVAMTSTAERAAADREWAFGHVIVDEAQELSPMAWRMLMRRCPAKSMTIVGDVAQTGDLGGSASWEQSLAPYLGDRWRLAPLTINYRTPAEIMTVAADVLAAIDPSLELPRSVRESGSAPWRLAVTPGEFPAAVADAAQRLAAQGIGVTVLDPRWALPVPAEVTALASLHQLVVTVEDGGRSGGVGAAVTDRLAGTGVPVKVLALPQEFLEPGTRGDLLTDLGLSAQAVARGITEEVARLTLEPVAGRSTSGSASGRDPGSDG